MKPFFLRACAVACLAATSAAGVSFSKPLPEPADFGSGGDWDAKNISLLRVISVNDEVVVLQAERTYTDYEPAVDTKVPLSAIYFGYEWPEGEPFPIPKAVSVVAGDELVVWPGRWQPREPPYLPGMKIISPAAKSPLLQTLDEISKIRQAGGRGQGQGYSGEIERVGKLREAGGETALKGGASSSDPTVVRYSLSTLESFPPKKTDQKFAEKLGALRADDSLAISVRLSANRLLRRYAAVPEDARMDAAQWPRSLFAAGKVSNQDDLADLTGEIISMSSKREDRVAYFLSIIRDEAKPRSVRVASVSALVDKECFDYEHSTAQASSDVFSAVLSLVNSNDAQFRKRGASLLHYVCQRIRSPQDRAARATEAIASLDAAIQKEHDPDVLTYMKANRIYLGGDVTRGLADKVKEALKKREALMNEAPMNGDVDP
jgi:hypothetical protein